MKIVNRFMMFIFTICRMNMNMDKDMDMDMNTHMDSYMDAYTDLNVNIEVLHGVNTIKCESSYNSRPFDFRSSLLT